jgi:hypothetical protein
MAAVTLEEFRARVRDVSDMNTTKAATHFIKNEMLDRRINAAIERLYDKLILAWGQPFFSTDGTIALVSGTFSYALPADFYLLSRLIVSDGGTWRRELQPFNDAERAILLEREQTGYVGLYSYMYQLRGSNVEIRPKPNASGHSLLIYYVPRFTRLVASPGTPNTFDGINGWEEWAVYEAACDLLIKEESLEQYGALRDKQKTISDQIDALAGNRDAGRPARVSDVRHDHAWMDFHGGPYLREPQP